MAHPGELYIFEQWRPTNIAGPGVTYSLSLPLSHRAWLKSLQTLEAKISPRGEGFVSWGVLLYPQQTVNVTKRVGQAEHS